ncbi:MAG TPA: CBS domain-containing protein [Acidimicrobiales bacterium]|nr:CBS domain-containing protein [Acidimicrobiales bacterium]
MRVSELMHTPAVTCRPEAAIGDVARLMRDRNVGSVIVVDGIGYLAGIVTDRDVAVRGVGEGLSADVAVEEIMSRNVATIPLQADVSHAAGLMVKRTVRRLPVVDENDIPHGMLTLDDLVRQIGRDADAVSDTVMLQAANLSHGP